MAPQYRVGLIVPSSNTTMETELPAMLRRREETAPERFTFHSGRTRMRNVTPDELGAMVAASDRAAGELADARVDVIAYACLVAVMAQGERAHTGIEQRLAQTVRENGCEAPVVSSAGALVNALLALGAKRIALVAPYMKPLTAMVCDYLEACGVAVARSVSLEVSDNLAVGRLDPAALPGIARELEVTDVDALVLSACVQMPSLPSIELVERELGLPVVSAATATTFAVLSALGLPTIVPHAGRLLTGHVAAAATA